MNGVNYRPLLEDMTWSFSRLKTYSQCPQQWRSRYLMDEPDEDLFYAAYGSFCHELIARFYKGELARDELLPEFLQGYFNRLHGLERPTPDTDRKYLDAGAFYFEHFEPFPLKTLLVEHPINLDLDGLKFTGIIDYLGMRGGDGDRPTELIVVDHKSADLKPFSKRYPSKPTQTDLKLDDTLRQLYLYAGWVREAYGVFPTELWLNCFRTDTLIKEPFDERKYDAAVAWAKEQVGRIMNEDLFLPTDDYYYCRWICGQHRNCDLYEEEYAPGRRRH